MQPLTGPGGSSGLSSGATRQTVIRAVAVGAVFLLALALALRGSSDLKILVLAAIIGVIGVTALFNWPGLGLLSIIAGAFFIPFSGPGGLNAAVLLVAAMTGVMFIDMLARQRKIQFSDTRTTLAIIIFMLSAGISFLAGQIYWYVLTHNAPLDAQSGGLAIFLLSGFSFLIVANLAREVKWLEWFTWLYMAVAVIYIAGRLYQPLGSFLRPYFQPGAATNSVFWIWMLVIPFSQAFLNNKLSTPVRAGLFAFCGLVLYVSIFQAWDWKSGFIPPLAGVVFIVLLRLRRFAFLFIPFALITAVILAMDAISSEDYSWYTRMEAWIIVLRIAQVSPILGMGFGNYYHYTPLFPINGWHVSFNSHNQYVDIIAQTGILGLVAFIWVLWEIGMLGWRLRDRAPAGFAHAYVYGALGGLLGMFVSGALVDWILPFVYNIGMAGFRSAILGWMFLGGLVTIKGITERMENSTVDKIGSGGNDG